MKCFVNRANNELLPHSEQELSKRGFPGGLPGVWAPKRYLLADHPPRGHIPSLSSWKHHKGAPRSLGSVVLYQESTGFPLAGKGHEVLKDSWVSPL